jgi:hypothetical protein
MSFLRAFVRLLAKTPCSSPITRRWFMLRQRLFRLRPAPDDHARVSRDARIRLRKPLGTKIGCPDKPVLALCGDGVPLYRERIRDRGPAQHRHRNHRFQRWHPQECASYAVGPVRQPRHRVRPQEPDFVPFAESFGAAAQRAEGPKLSHRPCIGHLINRPVIIEASVDKMPTHEIFSSRKVIPLIRRPDRVLKVVCELTKPNGIGARSPLPSQSTWSGTCLTWLPQLQWVADGEADEAFSCDLIRRGRRRGHPVREDIWSW